MITIFHGDNFIASRQALNQAVPSQPIRFNLPNLSAESLTQALESNQMFSHNQAVLIENLLGSPRSKLKDSLLAIILANQDKQIYLWEKKAITPTVKKQFSKAQIKEFKLTQSLFKFLDNFQLTDFHSSLDQNPIELIFYMFHRRVSQLIQISTEPQSVKAAPWQLQKLKTQTKNLSLTKLLKLHQKLLEIDEQLKTGQTNISLTTQLDLLLISL